MLKILKQKVKYLSIQIQDLATNAALIADENKISVVSSLVKKTDYDVKVPDIKSKYFNAVN